MSDHPPFLLRAAGVAVLVDVPADGLPRVLHWGADPGALSEDDRSRLVDDLVVGVPHSALDDPWPLTLLPGQVDGWSGRPGLLGDRSGADLFPRWTTTSARETADGAATVLTVDAAAPASGLALTTVLRLEASGLLRIRHALTNAGDSPFRVDGMIAVLPVPETATELLDLTGRWCRERSPQRVPLTQGTHARESRRGRTGHDATLLMAAGTAGFGFRHGQVWATHVAWSGDHVHLAERLPEGAGSGGAAVLGGGELPLPGEIVLAAGESYETPWVCFAWSDEGLDGVSRRLHGWLRARPHHPHRPRPLVLNTWEAAYFDHDLETLTRLAEKAAAIGVERFVLDDGWFGARRHDGAGLGDWFVSADVWPDGLEPLADRVRALGMEFGLWFEPEMVNLDSDLVREHPDWILGPAPDSASGSGSGSGHARPWRRQYALDVAVPGAFDYLLDRLDTLVKKIGIAYIKWDMNRDLHESLHPGADGARRGGVHGQTLALYRLLDALRERNPGLEIESCASGGARVDLGILERTDRVWASDTNDALERQAIQRWTALLLPPELIGQHVGPPISHTTGRVAETSFRALTALFGHAGLEWDVTTCSAEETAQLAAWGALYKEVRSLLHTGDLVRADTPDEDAWLFGVVAPDRRHGLFEYVRLVTSAGAQPGRLRLPGLDRSARYEVVRRDDAGVGWGTATRRPPWWERGRTTCTGAVLEDVGLPAPMLNPAQAVLVEVRAV